MKDSAILRFLIAFTAVWTSGIILLNLIGPAYQIHAVEKFTIFAQLVQRTRNTPSSIGSDSDRSALPPMDMSATASIPRNVKAVPAAPSGTSAADTQRPLTAFQLVYVTGDRIILQSGRQIIDAKVGQVVPGAGRILELKRRGKNWMVVTTSGTIYEKQD